MGQPARTYQQHKDRMFDYLGGMCVWCLSTNDLEIDHIDPEDKVQNLGQMKGVGWEKLLVELEKCQLLCHRCHWRKTNGYRREKTSRAHGHPGYRIKACEKCHTEYRELQEKLRDFYD